MPELTTEHISRRKYIETVAAGVGAAVAGCLGDDEEEWSDLPEAFHDPAETVYNEHLPEWLDRHNSFLQREGLGDVLVEADTGPLALSAEEIGEDEYGVTVTATISSDSAYSELSSYDQFATALKEDSVGSAFPYMNQGAMNGFLDYLTYNQDASDPAIGAVTYRLEGTDEETRETTVDTEEGFAVIDELYPVVEQGAEEDDQALIDGVFNNVLYPFLIGQSPSYQG